MATSRRVIGWERRLIAGSPFESGVVVIAMVYVALRLSPSSYALALGQLGEDVTPLLGTPRAVRSDEWSVMTPLFEAAVNNDFRETNDTSFYGETLRSFIGLPLLNWGLVFKPLVLPFFVAPAAFAYSFFWAANAALMLAGWSLLLRAFGFSRLVAALTTSILYFSPLVQAWSGPGPQIALFPWLVLAFVRIRSPVWLAAAFAVLVPVWWMSMFYVPALPPLVFLALGLCLAFRPDAFAWRRLGGALAGAVAGAAVALAYFAPVLRAYTSSEYPGHRWVTGGGMSLWQVASQFLPATTTENYGNLIAANISEAATVATWVPLLALCIVDVRAVKRGYADDPALRRHVRAVVVLLAWWALLTAWQLVPLSPLSYVFGLGLSLEGRTLFASGALLLVATAHVVDKLPVRVTPIRLASFALLVIAGWLLASLDLQATNELQARDELLVVPLVLAVAAFSAIGARPGGRALRGAVLVVALVPTALVWGNFNPLQSTSVMFRKPDTPVTRRLDELAATRPDAAIAVEGVPDAVLNGVGYRSVTHVVATPSPDLFRPYFPDLDEERFDEIFNRYAHISLTDRSEPFLAAPDVIRLPIRTMRMHAATGKVSSSHRPSSEVPALPLSRG